MAQIYLCETFDTYESAKAFFDGLVELGVADQGYMDETLIFYEEGVSVSFPDYVYVDWDDYMELLEKHASHIVDSEPNKVCPDQADDFYYRVKEGKVQTCESGPSGNWEDA
jgi:viroplasmin and RNaseH domain-containing protein